MNWLEIYIYIFFILARWPFSELESKHDGNVVKVHSQKQIPLLKSNARKMVPQNPHGSSWKPRSMKEKSVLCQMSFLLIVTIYYPKLAVFPLWDSPPPDSEGPRQHLISVPLALLQLTYGVSRSMLSTIKGAARVPDSVRCRNKATADSLWMTADTWPATHATPWEATQDLPHHFIYQSWLKLHLHPLLTPSPGVLADG